MIWLTWRQFRGQALTALGAITALTIYLLILGMAIRNSYDTTIIGCETTDSCSGAMKAFEDQYGTQLVVSFALLIILPAVIGTFWGAPLIARELETGTHQLVWNQSVTRKRWLAIKLAVIGLFSVALTAALSLLITWAASPYDDLQGDRFAAVDFASRNIVPLGYAAFAFVLGTTVGLIVRRTIPAMALTLAIFAAIQILIPTAIRPHLQTPVTDTVAYTAAVLEQTGGHFTTNPDGAQVHEYSIPGAWMLTSTNLDLRDAAGDPVDYEEIEGCMTGLGPEAAGECLVEQDLHFTVSYHPADRYWTFQWLEFGTFLLLPVLLAGFAFWRIPRVHK